jgi:GAF domain-containing protein
VLERDAEDDLRRLLLAGRVAGTAAEQMSRWSWRLQATADAAVTEGSLDALLNDASASIRRALTADAVAILIANEAGDELVTRISFGLTGEVQGVRILSGIGVAGQVLASHQALVVEDLSKVELASPVLGDSGLRSAVAVPLLAGEHVLGVLEADSFEPGHFGPLDTDLLTIVGDRLAAAIERVRLFEAERAARTRAEVVGTRLRRLHDITAALSEDVGIDGIAGVVTREVAPAFGAQAVSATLWLIDGPVLRLVPADGVPPTAEPFDRMALDAAMPGPDAIRAGQPVWITSRAERDERYPTLGGAVTLGESCAVVPLLIEDTVHGVLALSVHDAHRFDEDERQFLRAVADQASQAIDRARLRQAEARVTGQLAFLAEASMLLASSLDYEDVLGRVARLLVPALADLALVHLFEDDGSLRRVTLAHHDRESERAIISHIRDRSYPELQGYLTRVARQRQVVVMPDASGLLRDAGLGWASERFRLGSAILAPLVVGDEAVGLLSLIRMADSVPYDGDATHLAEEVARRAAVAIDNSRLHRRLQSARQSQEFLLAATRVLAEATGYRETLERLASVAVPTLGDLCLIDVAGEDGSLKRMAARHADPRRQPLADEIRRRYPPDPDGAHPSAQVIRTGRSTWSAEMPEAFMAATTRDADHLRLVKDLEFTSFMTVPLLAGGRPLGTVTLVSAGSGRRFGPSDLSLAEELARQVAAVVAKARRYEEEHDTAHTLQGRLLPGRLPELAEVTMEVRYLPGTRGAEVGGDFYDAVTLPGGGLGLMIGDVAGHDAVAAATMGQLRSAIRALAGQQGAPARLLDSLQWSWDLLGFDRIATALLARLDPSSGDLVVASAGHPPPLLAVPGHARFLPVSPAPPLGSVAGPAAEWHGSLGRGETLLFFTDGLIEGRHVGVADGMARLARLAAAGTVEPDRLCDRVLGALSAERHDDVAVLAVSRHPGA